MSLEQFADRIKIDECGVKRMCQAYLLEHWRDTPTPESFKIIANVLRCLNRHDVKYKYVSPNEIMSAIESYTEVIDKAMRTFTQLNLETPLLVVILHDPSDKERVQQSSTIFHAKMKEYSKLASYAQFIRDTKLLEYAHEMLETSQHDETAQHRWRKDVIDLQKMQLINDVEKRHLSIRYYMANVTGHEDSYAQYIDALNHAHLACLSKGVEHSLEELGRL